MKQTPTVPVLETALRVIDAIASGEGDGSVQKLASSLDIAPATCYRILCTLEQGGWISSSNGHREISAGLVAQLLSNAPWRQLVDVAKEPLRQLAQKTELSAKLSIRQGADAVTIVRAESPRAMAVSGRTGARFPLVYGSSGATLCADLDEQELEQVISAAPEDAWKRQSADDFRQRVAEAREKQACVDSGSFHPQVHTVSVPVKAGGATIAAVTLMGLPGDIDPAATPALIKHLKLTAKTLTAKVAQ